MALTMRGRKVALNAQPSLTFAAIKNINHHRTMTNLTFEAFESEWLIDILDNNPNLLQKGRRYSRKLIAD